MVRVFHELAWVEDMGSGTRNILRYAPLYYPNYKIEINNSSQFIFSITYMDMFQENIQMSQETSENVPRKQDLSQENTDKSRLMSQESPRELEDEELKLSCKSISSDNKAIIKKRKRQQAIIGLIKATPNITMEVMAEKLDVTERTIKRDIEELKSIIEHVGPTKGGFWIIVASKNQVP